MKTMKEIKDAIVAALQEGDKRYVELGKVVMDALNIDSADYYVALNELKDEGIVVVEDRVYRLTETKTMREIKAEKLVSALNARLVRLMCTLISVKAAFTSLGIQGCKARKQANYQLFVARVTIERIDKIANAYNINLSAINGYDHNVKMIDKLFDFFNL